MVTVMAQSAAIELAPHATLVLIVRFHSHAYIHTVTTTLCVEFTSAMECGSHEKEKGLDRLHVRYGSRFPASPDRP